MHWRNVLINGAIGCVLGLLVGFGMIFNSPTSWFVTEFTLLLLVILILPLLWPLRNHLKFMPDNPDLIANRPATRHLTVTQGKWLPNLFLLDTDKTNTWHLPIGQRTAKVTLQLPRGIHEHLPFTVTVTDLFGWFRKTLPLRLATPVTVGPARQPETATQIAAQFTKKMAAADAGLPSDRIKNFRDYFPGDNIQQIAWKVSAHADALIVHDDEYEGQTSWTLMLLVTPSLPLEPALSLFASLMDTGIFSGDGYLVDQRLTRIVYGQHNSLLAGFQPQGTATPNLLQAFSSSRDHRAYLVLAADAAAAATFMQVLAPAAATLIPVTGGDHHA